MKKVFWLTTILLALSNLLFSQSDQIGKLHNEGLDYVKVNSPTPFTFSNLSESSERFLNIINAWPVEHLISEEKAVSLLQLSVGQYDLFAKSAEDKINLISSYNHLCQSDVKVLNELYYLFKELVNEPVVENYTTRFREKLSALKGRTSNQEILAGLSVAEYSSKYWENNPNIPGNEIAIIIQLDCLGYIVGWGDAVIDDYEAGNLHPSGGNRRIRKGLHAALLTSSGGFLK